jgi:hypothetical protein
MNTISRYCLIVGLLLCASMSFAHGEKKHHDMTPPDSLAISVASDAQANLWRVGVSDGFVELSKSNDLGKTFSKPVKVNLEQQKITAHGEVRPKIKIGKNGEIYVVWMQNLRARFAGYVWFARSVNGGKSFEAPFVVHQDRAEIGHAFEEISVAPNGDITVVWLDARDLVANKKAGKKRSGSSIYYAVSKDSGKTFEQEKKLADNTCECCRIVTTNKPDGTVVALWRHVFEGSERDHMIAEIPSNPPALGGKLDVVSRRATFGHWVIDGCPHHGAALASGGEGNQWWGYHMAYFDGNDKQPGLYYSRMDGVAWASSPPKKFGDNKSQAGHPALLAIGQQVWLVWREIKDGKSSIWRLYSADEGKTWGEPKLLVSATEKTDYPILIQDKNVPYLVWNTQQTGLKVLTLTP